MCWGIDNKDQKYEWTSEKINSPEELFKRLDDYSTLKHRWVFRGVPRKHELKLIPSIDRDYFKKADTREKKIKLEREAIEIYRNNVKFFIHPDYQKLLLEDITTLMLMQHYGAPTRLLDWSLSPIIAAFFATHEDVDNDNDKDKDGVIWCFDYDRYLAMGSCQWNTYTEMREGDKFDDKLSPAFRSDYNNNWFVCQFLTADEYKFPRILAQDGLFSFVSQFNKDHAIEIKELLKGNEYQHIFIIKHEIKKEVLQKLNETYHIWYGSIYPDNVGIALGTMYQLKNKYR